MSDIIPDDFDEYSEDDYWGISPISILLANNAYQSGSKEAEEAIQRYYDITVTTTNFELDRDTFRKTLDDICRVYLNEHSSLAAVCADSETARLFMAGAVYQRQGGVMRALRLAQDIFRETDEGEPVIVSRTDLRGLVNEADVRLLRSLQAIRAVPDGYEFDTDLLEALQLTLDFNQSEAAWALLEQLCISLGVREVDSVVEILLEEAEISPPEKKPISSTASLPILLNDDRISRITEWAFDDGFEATVNELRKEVSDKRSRYNRSLRFARKNNDPEECEWPICDEQASICALASQQNVPVIVDWFTEKLDVDQFEFHRRLSQAGFDVTLEDDLVLFNRSYARPAGEYTDSITEYEDWLANQIEWLERAEHRLADLEFRLGTGWTRQRRSLLEATINRLQNHVVSPTRFTFSLFDPEYHADEYEVDQYIGESPHLEDEVRRIREWRRDLPPDATSFAEVVPEVCSYPLENEDAEPRLRIMSPWLNFAIQDYTALFNRLLQNDINIQLLFRLPDPSDWNDLKNNLLTRIGDTRGNLELRTYTRFKKFHSHSEIRELKRDESNSEYIGETGIHAKLFIAGTPENGSVLAGSANLMENSLYYNPEAGLQTRHPEAIRTAIEFFDLIWELSAPDHINESVFRGETNFQFYPKVYRP